MCSEPGFGASVSGSLTTTGAGSPSRLRLWAARCWPRLPPLPHPLRCYVGTATADRAYQNAKQNSDKQNARIEHDKALRRVMTALLQDDTELFKQFSDNESFRRWLTDTIFAITYEAA